MIGIRLDADDKIGIGHLSRCLPLAAEWLKMGDQVEFFCKESEFIRNKLSPYAVKLTVVPELTLTQEMEFINDAASECSILLLDSYRLSDDYIDELSSDGRLLCCMDDDALYTYSCDVVINPHPFADRLSFRFGKKQPKLLLGGQYWVFRDEFIAAKPIEIKARVERVFVTMGGADVNNRMPDILEMLAGENVEVIAVVGPIAGNYREVEEIASKSPRTTLVGNPPSMAGLMVECDIAISAGGNTIYELCALGIPTIVLPQTANERVKARYLAEDGIVANGDDLLVGFRRLCGSVCKRAEMSEKMRWAISRDGRSRLARELIKGG